MINDQDHKHKNNFPPQPDDYQEHGADDSLQDHQLHNHDHRSLIIIIIAITIPITNVYQGRRP